MKGFCIICGARLRLEARKGSAYGVGTLSEISGRSVREVIISIFPNDEELQLMLRRADSDPEFPSGPEKAPALCLTCYNLTEQIDAFQLQLNQSLESIVLRRDKVTSGNFSTNKKLFSSTEVENSESGIDCVHDSSLKVEISMKVEPAFDDDDDDDDRLVDISDTADFLLNVPVQEACVKNEGVGRASARSNSDIVGRNGRLDGDSADYISENGKKRLGKTESTTSSKTSLRCSSYLEMADLFMVKDPIDSDELLSAEGDDDDLRQIVMDLEADVKFLKEKFPNELDCHSAAIEWDIFLLRSETDLSTSGLSGEKKCFLCSKDFETIETKIRHVVNHRAEDQEEIFSCGQCVERFGDEEEAFFHTMTEHQPNLIKSHVALAREPQLVRMADGDDRFSCSRCAVVCSTELGYWLHYWTRHKKYSGRELKCRVCQTVTGKSAAALRRHLMVKHLGYKYRCTAESCDFETCRIESFRSHLESHAEGVIESNLETRKQKSNVDGKLSSSNAGDKAEDGGERQSKKPPERVSQLAKRSRRMTPLTIYERANINPDQYLVEATTSQDCLTRLPHLKTEMDEHLQLLRSMPDIIRTTEQAVVWDVVMLRVEATKMALGVPGENKCFECDADIKNPSDRLSHRACCHNRSGVREFYKCTACSKSWSSEESAFHHVRTEHFDLWKQDNLEKREPQVLEDGELRCRYCSVVATSELAFWLHTAGRHKRFKKVRCPICNQICCNGPQYRRHILSYHGQYLYQCPGCSFNNKSIDVFKVHIREHEHRKRVEEYDNMRAERAAKGLPEEEQEEDQVAADQPPEPMAKKGRKVPVEFMTCHLCGRESRGEKFHAKHMFTQHGVALKMPCVDCGQECRSIRDLEVHRRAEHCVASCHLCGKSFFTAGHLTSHLRNVHDLGGKSQEFICEKCARSFPSKAYLRIHMRTHKEKHIKCQLCPKMFRWESGLYSHMAAAHAHSAQLYNCEFCGKEFKDKSNLKSHRYTHLDVKPHSCSRCGRGFIRRDMMLTHEKNCRL